MYFAWAMSDLCRLCIARNCITGWYCFVKWAIRQLYRSRSHACKQLMRCTTFLEHNARFCMLACLRKCVICSSGVRVNIMIWDEIDSGDDLLTYTRVAKKLHGGGASEFFKETEVSVKLMPRKSSAPQVSSNTRAQNTINSWLQNARQYPATRDIPLKADKQYSLMLHHMCINVVLVMLLQAIHLILSE